MNLKRFLLRAAARQMITDKQKPITHSDLKYIGVDSEGVRYYGFEDLSLLPNCRRIELEKAAMFMDAKLDPDTIASITEQITLTGEQMRGEKDEKKRGALQAKIIAYTDELSRREKYGTSKHFHIEIASILNISENEIPTKIDREAHNLKSVQFEKELDAGNAFFFRNPMYCALLNLSLGIETNLQMLYAGWDQDEKISKERLKAISSFESFSVLSNLKPNG